MAKKKTTKKKAATKPNVAAKKPASRKTKTKLIDDLCQHLQVGKRTVRRWVKDGCPCVRRKQKGKKGSPQLWFDLAKVEEWLASHDIQTGAGGTTEAGGQVPPPSVAPPDTEEDAAKPGIVGAIARLRNMEKLAYNDWGRALLNHEGARTIRAKEKIYLEAHQALRRSEKDLPKILESRGEALPLETILDEQARIDLAVKTQFLTLPRKLAPMLADIDPKLSRSDRIIETEVILQGEIDDCLRHITSGEKVQDITPEQLPAA